MERQSSIACCGTVAENCVHPHDFTSLDRQSYHWANSGVDDRFYGLVFRSLHVISRMSSSFLVQCVSLYMQAQGLTKHRAVDDLFSSEGYLDDILFHGLDRYPDTLCTSLIDTGGCLYLGPTLAELHYKVLPCYFSGFLGDTPFPMSYEEFTRLDRVFFEFSCMLWVSIKLDFA